MNATNNYSNILNELRELYSYGPTKYDIAVKIFRTTIVGLTAREIAGILINACEYNPSQAFLPNFAKTAIAVAGVSYLVLFSGTIALHEIYSSLFHSHLNKTIAEQNKEYTKQNKKDVFLLCIPSADWNGYANNLINKEYCTLNELSKTHSLVIQKISTIADINNVIDRIQREDRKIETLWIKAHGTADQVRLGKDVITGKDPGDGFFDSLENLFFRSQRVSVDKINFEKLSPKTNIVLSSCNTGGKPTIVNGLNIAEWFQFYAGPQRQVFAPRDAINNNGTHRMVNSNGEISYRFTNIFGSDTTSDISYSKVIEKIRSDKRKPQNSWVNKIPSIFAQYRSFDYRELLPASPADPANPVGPSL